MKRTFIISLFVTIISIIVFSCSTYDSPPTGTNAVDSVFSAVYNSETPGCAIGVIKNGEFILAKGYGLADLEHNIPITPSTVFYIGSVSKQFVAMCILLLEEQGKINLDDEVQKYLPDFPKYEKAITINNFIHHTSGVRDNLTLMELAGYDYLDHFEDEAVYDLIKQQKSLNFPPGEKYLYSNSCYFMLAMIVEKVSGQSLKNFAEENIFKPLGMKNTHFHDNYKHIIRNRAFSYEPSEEGFNNLIMRFDLVGSGGLYSSIDDLLLWDRNFYNNKLGKGGQDIIKKMHEEGLLSNGQSCGYAFALINGEYRGLKTVSHGGALAGYRAQLMRFPDQQFSVILLGNISTFDATGMAKKVADIYLGDLMKNNPEVLQQTVPQKTDNDKSAHIDRLDLYTGTYFSEELNTEYKIFELSNDLFCQVRVNNPVRLNYIGNNTFHMSDGRGELLFKNPIGNTFSEFILNAGRVENLSFKRTN